MRRPGEAPAAWASWVRRGRGGARGCARPADLEEARLRVRVVQLKDGRVAEDVAVKRLELDQQVEVQPLHPLGVRRAVARVLHRLLHRVGRLHAADGADAAHVLRHLRRVQQQRLEEEHACGVRNLEQELLQVGPGLPGGLRRPLLDPLQPHLRGRGRKRGRASDAGAGEARPAWRRRAMSCTCCSAKSSNFEREKKGLCR